ncbi:MAG: hypothetical protein ACRYGK_05320 [Janthinobacterium lividum]
MKAVLAAIVAMSLLSGCVGFIPVGGPGYYQPYHPRGYYRY